MKNSISDHDITEVIPPINDLSKKEINFINNFFDEMKIDFDGDFDLGIETDPEEFGCFIVYAIRRYLRKE